MSTPLTDNYTAAPADTPLGNALAFTVRTGRRVLFIAQTAKVPLRGSHGHLDASSDPDVIAAMYPGPNCRAAWRPDDDELVMDTDPQNGYIVGSIDLPTTETYGPTPHGGAHFVYKRNGYDVRQAADVRTGVDFKTEAGWLVLYDPFGNGVERVDAPAWVATAQTRNRQRFTVPETIPEGEIDNTLVRIAGSLHNAGLTEDEIAETLAIIADRRAPTHTHTASDFERIARQAANWKRTVGRIGEIVPNAAALRRLR